MHRKTEANRSVYVCTYLLLSLCVLGHTSNSFYNAIIRTDVCKKMTPCRMKSIYLYNYRKIINNLMLGAGTFEVLS